MSGINIPTLWWAVLVVSSNLQALRPCSDEPSARPPTDTMLAWPIQQALLTAFSFISFVLVIIPLYWHLEGTPRSSVGPMAWLTAP